MLLNSPKQYESVLQVANRNTEFIDSPAMQRCLEASDFQLSELKTRPGGLSVYLCLPQRYMSTHYRWLRMMIALTVTEMEKVRGQPATGYPVLMVLDEFAGLKRMEVIENAVAQIAGYGVKLFFVLQSLEQLKAVYKDNWETFLANSGLKVFFNLEDHFSRDYVSKLIGETEVIREVRSQATAVGIRKPSHSTSRSQSESRGGRPPREHRKPRGQTAPSAIPRQVAGAKSESVRRMYKLCAGLFFRNYDNRESEQQKLSRGKSKAWTKGQSHGYRTARRARARRHFRESQTSMSETEGTTAAPRNRARRGRARPSRSAPSLPPMR